MDIEEHREPAEYSEELPINTEPATDRIYSTEPQQSIIDIVISDDDEYSLKNGSIISQNDGHIATGYSNKVEFRGCGPWGSDCTTGCRYVCTRIMSCGCICNKLKPLYFFILYLLTGESDSRANVYKNYFKIEKTKDDNKVSVFQILETIAVVCFEMYKTLIGSFLTVFTSQRCGEQTCTIWQNFLPKNELELAGLVCNFLMATSLFIEYIFEIMREGYLITYLKYDYDIANNGFHISELYESSDKTIFKKLIPLYIIYIRFSYVVLVIYLINVSLSAAIIRTNYYDNTSLFGFITNALFIIYKIYNVVEITSYKGNYFYSAYKRKNMHYNTIRPQYLLKTINDTTGLSGEHELPLPNTTESVSLENAPESTNNGHNLENRIEDGTILLSPKLPKEISLVNPDVAFRENIQIPTIIHRPHVPILPIQKARAINTIDLEEGTCTGNIRIMETSQSNYDKEDEDDADNYWNIDDAYTKKLKKIQEMRLQRMERELNL